MSDSSKLLTCAEFRVKRDQFQAERRKAALPALKAEKKRIDAGLTALSKKLEYGNDHANEIVYNNMKPLQWQKQELSGQIAMIELGK